MNRLLKRLICIPLAALCLFTMLSFSVSAEGEDGRRFVVSNGVSDSYTYSKVNGSRKVVASPNTYLPEFVVDSASLGVELVNPSHITAKGDTLYIVNTGKNNIIITDQNFKVIKVLDGFMLNGEMQTFSAPQGCFITNSGLLYIADTENQRIVVLSQDFELVQIINTPKSDVLAKDFVFKPQKIVVDTSDRIFVVADGVYEGIMQFYGDGSFIGFVGSIPVTANPVEIIWKKLLTKEQTSKMQQFVPVSYTNIFLDSDEFMYTVSLSTTLANPIRRLNPGGADVLIRNALVGTTVAGDQIGKTSQFVAICADENNIYYAADSVRNRIFVYDEDGNLLSVFGGSFQGRVGTYKHISSLLLFGDNLIVVDSQASIITSLYPTEYMETIKAGLNTYRTGKYEESHKYWTQVYALNSNFDLAYSKIGMIEIRNKNYEKAMEYFLLANDQENYSTAYTKYRTIWYTENLSYIITAILVVVVAIVVINVWRKKRVKK